MSRDVISIQERQAISSAELAAEIAAAGFSGCAATVVGYGTMGRHHVKALQALGVRRIRVCSRSAQPLEELAASPSVKTVAGGVEQLDGCVEPDELGIIAVPTGSLVAATERLVTLGFRRLLIEKPVSLWSAEIEQLAEALEHQGVEAACAYNRVAYPSFHEARSRAAQEEGITSCTYTLTEMIRPDWSGRFPAHALARWGIANSLHVASMAHGLIGWPAAWKGYRSGALEWHPTGSVFVGAGLSDRSIPFTYHADWGSLGRWSVEIHTRVSSYRLCPLEKLFRRTSATGEWEAVPVATWAPQVKAGLVEQVATMLSQDIRQLVGPVSLRAAAALARYAETLFGYENK